MVGRNWWLGIAAFLIAATVGCAPADDDDDSTPEPACENDSAPEVLVQPVEDGQPVGFEVQVAAQVSDPDGISTVSLYYRTEGAQGFAFTFMSNDESGAEDIYLGTIPASVVQDPGVDYYVRATDRVVPCTGETLAPEDAPELPARFETRLDVELLPFYADFEFDDGLCIDANLEDQGWAVAFESFPQGIHNWRTDDRNPLSGACSASHSEGIPGGFWECPPPDGEGTIVRKNWLISPPLDFTAKQQIAVRWFERHLDSGICAEAHRLFVSTTFPDPALGEYTQVAELELPQSAWQSSAWHDLSEFAGNEKVYVALYYEGGSAGRWQVDDFYVGEPLADLELSEVSALPQGTVPGSTGVEIDVTLVNTSENYSAPPLSAILTTADSQLSIVSSEASYGEMAPGATAQGSAPFVFDVSATHPDHSYLDFAVQLSDGEGHQWAVPVRLLMGQESIARVSYSASEELHLELGHGPPVAPDFSVAIESAAPVDGSAQAPWEVNVTDEAQLLPPGPGPRRWFLRARNEGAVSAELISFELLVGGVAAAAEGLPVSLAAGAEALLLLPPPPVLEVAAFSVSPDPVAPGGSHSLDALELRNDGAATVGPVSCVLGSSDPDVVSISTTPVSFGGTALAGGASAVADSSFSLEIAASHTDNSPVELVLLCSDGADTLPVSFAVEVPYAHPRLEAVRLDDDAGGDDDGLAEPGELVEVFLTARNEGAFDTSGPLTAQVQAALTSVAPFTLSASAPLEFGTVPLEAGATMESSNSFQIAVDSSALMGDAMLFDVVWTAGTDTWTEQLLIDVTGLPWLPCPALEDPQGDVVGGGEFDIRSCSYRSDGTMLEVQVESWVPYTAATLFLDVFFYEVPGLFSVETVGGVPDFEDGCVFGDDLVESVPIAVDLSDSPTATVRVALTDMNILGNNTQVAFGAGSCPGVYFCDTYPAQVLSFDLEQGSYNCDGSGFIPLNW